MILNDKCPKCGNETLYQGYGLCGGGIGVYEGCDHPGCDYFHKTPDPELSTPEEMEHHAKTKGETHA